MYIKSTRWIDGKKSKSAILELSNPIKPTHEVAITTTSEQTNSISVGIVDARVKGKGRTIIIPLAFDARLIDEPPKISVEIVRMQAIAEANNARVIAIEYPGVGISEDAHMPIWRSVVGIFGQYKWPAKQMLRALQDVVIFHNNEEIDIWGYSQGAAIAAALIREITFNDEINFKINHIVMIEPINSYWRFLPEIVLSVNREVRFGEHHFRQNSLCDWLDKDISDDKLANIESLKKDQSGATVLSGLPLSRSFAGLIIDSIKKDIKDSTSGVSKAKFEFVKFRQSMASAIPLPLANKIRTLTNSSVIINVVSAGDEAQLGNAIDKMPYASAEDFAGSNENALHMEAFQSISIAVAISRIVYS